MKNGFYNLWQLFLVIYSCIVSQSMGIRWFKSLTGTTWKLLCSRNCNSCYWKINGYNSTVQNLHRAILYEIFRTLKPKHLEKMLVETMWVQRLSTTQFEAWKHIFCKWKKESRTAHGLGIGETHGINIFRSICMVDETSC